MAQSYFLQVIPGNISCFFWCDFLLHFIFGNSAIMRKHGGFFYI